MFKIVQEQKTKPACKMPKQLNNEEEAQMSSRGDPWSEWGYLGAQGEAAIS